MLFPMAGSLTSISGPPTEFARSMWPLLLLVLAVQTVICILRIVLVLDIMGGFTMAIAIGLGWYATKKEMNMTFICYWGLMCLFNGIFDSVQLVDFMVKLPSMALVVQTLIFWVLVLIPVSMLGGSVLAWYLYKDHQQANEADSGYMGSSFGLRGDAFSRSGTASAEGRSQLSRDAAAMPNFATFCGKGHKLGEV